jgi:hypothetical protein
MRFDTFRTFMPAAFFPLLTLIAGWLVSRPFAPVRTFIRSARRFGHGSQPAPRRCAHGFFVGLGVCLGLASTASSPAQSPAPLAITSAATSSGLYGTSFTFNVTANVYPATFSATGLPAGLMISPSSGVIYGLPADVGTLVVALRAEANSAVATSTLTLTLSYPTHWALFPFSAENPANPTSDSAGNRYSFQGTQLFKTAPNGTTSTLATAEVYQPSAGITVNDFDFTSVTVDSAGTVYAAETNNGLGANPDPGLIILKITPSGTKSLTKVAISADPFGARPNCSIAVDVIGNVYAIAPDFSIREILPNGTVLLVATATRFNQPNGARGYPQSLAVSNGYVYTSGSIAGTSYSGNIGIGALGPKAFSFAPYATKEQLGGSPVGITADFAGNVYVTVFSDRGLLLDRIDANGVLTSTPVSSTTPSPALPFVQHGSDNTIAGNGDIYAVVRDALAASSGLPLNAIARISPNGTVSTLLPTTTNVVTPNGATTPITVTYGYAAVAADRAGNAFVTDQFVKATPANYQVGNLTFSYSPPSVGTIRKISPSGQSVTIDDVGPPMTVMTTDGSDLFGFIGSGLYQMTPSLSGIQTFNLPYSYTYPYGPAPVSMAFDAARRLLVVAGDTVYFAPTQIALAPPKIIFQPQSATILLGSSQTLNVAAADNVAEPLSYQWYANGSPVGGATGSAFTTSTPGSYTVVVSNSAGSATSVAATLAVTTSGGVSVGPSPTILAQPTAGTLAYGGSTTLTVNAVSTSPISYQWTRNGVVIPGATAASLVATSAGNYAVTVRTNSGTVTSSVATLVVGNRLVNISSRVQVGEGANVGIAGFVIPKTSDATKRVLLRAVGPSLTKFGLNALLARPVLSVFNAAGTVIASNSGWNDAKEIAAMSAAVGAFELVTGSADAAMIVDLAPGTYTAQVSGAQGGTGLALIEAYEAGADTNQLINISTRAQVGTGAQILIGGLVVGGTAPVRVLLRAAGPGLAQFGLSGVLTTPVLSLYDTSGKLMAVNTGWSNGSSNDAILAANAAASAGAFAFQPGSADCALVLTLPPGNYTTQVTGSGSSTGIALVEAYQLPP